jgi:hypothetical protein
MILATTILSLGQQQFIICFSSNILGTGVNNKLWIQGGCYESKTKGIKQGFIKATVVQESEYSVKAY